MHLVFCFLEKDNQLYSTYKGNTLEQIYKWSNIFHNYITVPWETKNGCRLFWHSYFFYIWDCSVPRAGCRRAGPVAWLCFGTGLCSITSFSSKSTLKNVILTFGNLFLFLYIIAIIKSVSLSQSQSQSMALWAEDLWASGIRNHNGKALCIVPCPQFANLG